MRHWTTCVGLDLGGTAIKSGRVDEVGQVAEFGEHLWRTGGDPVSALSEISRRLVLGNDAIVGLACAGTIDERGTLTHPTPHLPIATPAPLAKWLRQWTGRPCAVLNDADAAALAEHHFGAARSSRASITITVGTGVGCGIVCEGRLWRGVGGGAGELGHVPTDGDAMTCPCGVPGCAEGGVGGKGLAREARERGLEVGDAAELFARADAGDAVATDLRALGARRLGRLAAIAVHLLRPEVVVFGGKLVARAGEAYFAAVHASLLSHTMASHREGLRVCRAQLGEQAGVVGAACWACERAALT